MQNSLGEKVQETAKKPSYRLYKDHVSHETAKKPSYRLYKDRVSHESRATGFTKIMFLMKG